jgi:hypothetical protein
VHWVREDFSRQTRIKIGQKSAWYEADILEFLEQQREIGDVAIRGRVCAPSIGIVPTHALTHLDVDCR